MDFNLEKHIQASKAPKSVKRAVSKMPKGLVSKAKHEALKKKTRTGVMQPKINGPYKGSQRERDDEEFDRINNR